MALVVSFDSDEAVAHREARGSFLQAFLPALIQAYGLRTALDLGCGYGWFSNLLHDMGLAVTAVDVRQKNVMEAALRYPGIEFREGSVEEDLRVHAGPVDIGLCFGLLYHLENPFLVIRRMAEAIQGVVVIESIVWPKRKPMLALQQEGIADNQALRYLAMVPSESALIAMLYEAGFRGVYRPSALPRHRDFSSSLTHQRMRTVLLATGSKVPAAPSQQWGAMTFHRVPTQRLQMLGPARWETPWGTFLRNARHPKGVLLALLDGLLRRLPAAWPRLVWERLQPSGRPVSWPGWEVGAMCQPRSWTTMMRRLAWRWFVQTAGEAGWPMRWYGGITVRALATDEIARTMFVGGAYEPNEFLWLERALQPGMVMIDGGAHWGEYALVAAARVGAGGLVVAAEPSTRERQRLNTHLRLNGLSNVRVRPEALAQSCGSRELRVADASHSGHNSLGLFAYDGVRSVALEQVAAITIDALVREERLERVDLIKLDLEGGEVTALEGARQTLGCWRPRLLLEVSERALSYQGGSRRHLRALLADFGYQLYHVSATPGELVVCRCEGAGSENVVALAEPPEAAAAAGVHQALRRSA